jgi:hypothetical protein
MTPRPWQIDLRDSGTVQALADEASQIRRVETGPATLPGGPVDRRAAVVAYRGGGGHCSALLRNGVASADRAARQAAQR